MSTREIYALSLELLYSRVQFCTREEICTRVQIVHINEAIVIPVHLLGAH